MTDIQRVYVAHTINTVALSIISVYVPAYLLSLGNPLWRVILYYAVAPTFGLVIAYCLYVPLMKKWGLISVFKLYYPLKILELLLLFSLQYTHLPIKIIALVYGVANYAYWMPLNLLFVRHSKHQEMGSNMAKFFALPQLFGVIGPLLGALLMPFFGFWPIFVFAMIELLSSFVPLANIKNTELIVSFTVSQALKRFSKSKTLFLFEFFDNILEESNWFWPIYVFLLIGSLKTPGFVGSLESIGGAIFTLAIGKYANKHGKNIIPFAAILLLFITVLMMLVRQPINAYVLTVIVSFTFTLFLVSYFSTVLRTIKGEGEEEFLILREIPTLLGRMTVFIGIWLTLSHLQYFFIMPMVFTVILTGFYYWKKKHLNG